MVAIQEILKYLETLRGKVMFLVFLAAARSRRGAFLSVPALPLRPRLLQQQRGWRGGMLSLKKCISGGRKKNDGRFAVMTAIRRNQRNEQQAPNWFCLLLFSRRFFHPKARLARARARARSRTCPDSYLQ